MVLFNFLNLFSGDIPRHERSKIDNIFLVLVADYSLVKDRMAEVDINLLIFFSFPTVNMLKPALKMFL